MFCCGIKTLCGQTIYITLRLISDHQSPDIPTPWVS